MVREAPQQEGKGFRSGAILSRNSHWPKKCEALCGQTTIDRRTDWLTGNQNAVLDEVLMCVLTAWPKAQGTFPWVQLHTIFVRFVIISSWPIYLRSYTSSLCTRIPFSSLERWQKLRNNNFAVMAATHLLMMMMVWAGWLVFIILHLLLLVRPHNILLVCCNIFKGQEDDHDHWLRGGEENMYNWFGRSSSAVEQTDQV